jgi:hypothetical protein
MSTVRIRSDRYNTFEGSSRVLLGVVCLSVEFVFLSFICMGPARRWGRRSAQSYDQRGKFRDIWTPVECALEIFQSSSPVLANFRKYTPKDQNEIQRDDDEVGCTENHKAGLTRK